MRVANVTHRLARMVLGHIWLRSKRGIKKQIDNIKYLAKSDWPIAFDTP
jgi:hypothetical protein